MNCSQVHNMLYAKSISKKDVIDIYDYCSELEDSKIIEKIISKPMLWVGIYIAVASLFCILPMAADLLHGFRNKKLWFPCKYFTLNAASITVIPIAMKLPVDLTSPMPGTVDQFSKLGSMAFMCTMMSNFLPSLASKDDMELLANVIGLVILIITLVVNILIQLQTSIIELYYNIMYIYVFIMLYLLIISVTWALTTPTTKRILEFKYQATHKKASSIGHPIPIRMSNVEELVQHVRRYWVMVGTCSPQFVMASTQLCSAAGIICVPSTLCILYLHVVAYKYVSYKDVESDYKWSLILVFIIQSVGVAIGTIAPVFRCFATLSFKLSIKWSSNHIKVFKVEKYWTQKLLDWKQIHIPFPSYSRRSRALVNNLKNLILSILIIFQRIVVVSCKMMGLIPIGVVIFFVYCLYCWKSLKAIFVARSIASSHVRIQEHEQNDTKEDISNYALQLDDEIELSTRTLTGISKLMNSSIKKAEKKMPKYLLNLLEKSTGFEGVEKFESDEVQPLISVEVLNCWSLPVVTLTCIAIALPIIEKDRVGLLKSVGEGISYVRIVEETLNCASEYVDIQRAAMILWHEVEDKYMWLKNTLQRNTFNGKGSREVLKWFADKAEEIVVEINKSTNEEPLENSSDKLIVANSMYHIAKTIMLNYENNIEQISEDQLFSLLSARIADIMAACLTNLPRVIETKCHESVIEKREASVEDAAKLLGRTKEILNNLQVRKLPSLDRDQMAFIHEWQVHLKQSIP